MSRGGGRRGWGLLARVASAAALSGLASTAAFATPAPPAAADPGLRRAAAALRPFVDDDGEFLKPGPAASAALARRWAAVRAWSADWLHAHPRATAGAFAAALRTASGLQVQAQRLDARSLLAAVTDGAFGTAFVSQSRAGGRGVTAWTVEAPGAPAVAAFPPLEAWSPSRASTACGFAGEGGRLRCGPLTAEVALLAPEADGAPRFVLHGLYAQDAGATGAQLVSVWRWTGRGAQPLLVRAFGVVADQEQPAIDVRGGRLVVGAKGSWRQLFACGACNGRQERVTAVLPARGAAWAPPRSLTPEVDAVDALYDAAAHGRPTAGLAAPAVGATVRRQLADIRTAPGAGEQAGMVMAWKAAGPAGARTLCLETDRLGVQRFSLVRRGGGWWVAAVAPAAEPACDGAGSRS